MMFLLIGAIFATVVLAAFISVLTDIPFLFAYLSVVATAYLITRMVREFVILEIKNNSIKLKSIKDEQDS